MLGGLATKSAEGCSCWSSLFRCFWNG